MTSPKGTTGRDKSLGVRMSGLFLAVIGAIVAITFFAPFRRRGAELMAQSPGGAKMLLIGGCIGLALLVVGVVMASWYKQGAPTYRAHRPLDDPPKGEA